MDDFATIRSVSLLYCNSMNGFLGPFFSPMTLCDKTSQGVPWSREIANNDNAKFWEHMRCIMGYEKVVNS